MARSVCVPISGMEESPRVNRLFIIGIDPGRNGGIVGLTNGHINVIDKMPQQPTDLWGYFIDVLGVTMIGKENIRVFIEDVHSMPTDGSRAAFSFGRHLGNLDMVFNRFDLDVTRIIPHKWMAYYEMGKGKGESSYQYKKRLVEKAKDLAPHTVHNKITLATADAYLIAKYGWELLKKESQ